MHPQHSPLAFSPDNYSIIQKTPKGKKGDRQKRGKKGDGKKGDSKKGDSKKGDRTIFRSAIL
jgi:hypothetical protein